MRIDNTLTALENLKGLILSKIPNIDTNKIVVSNPYTLENSDRNTRVYLTNPPHENTLKKSVDFQYDRIDVSKLSFKDQSKDEVLSYFVLSEITHEYNALTKTLSIKSNKDSYLYFSSLTLEEIQP